jgi:hypothetical protein
MSERVLLPNGVTPIHYKLELSPNLENFEFVGNEEITIQVDESVDRITLHQNEVYVLSAVYKSSETGTFISVNETNYNNTLNTLTFVFDTKLPVGSGQLIIKFKGVLNNDMAGFYRSSYTDASGNKKFMASTQFESLDARRFIEMHIYRTKLLKLQYHYQSIPMLGRARSEGHLRDHSDHSRPADGPLQYARAVHDPSAWKQEEGPLRHHA